MRSELSTALLAGLGGMLGWGLADFFAKTAIDKVGSIVSLVWAHAFGTAVLLSVTLVAFLGFQRDLAFPDRLGSWALLLFFGALQATVYLLAYEGFGKGQIAVLNPIFASYSGLVAIVSVLVFGESLSAPLLAALALLFAGILMLNLDAHALTSGRINVVRVPGFTEVALAALCATVWTLGWDRFIGGKDWLVYALLMYTFMTFAVSLLAKAQRVHLSLERSSVWIFLALIGLCETGAYLAVSLGYSDTSLTSVVALLSGAFSLPTILLARVFLRERPSSIQTCGSLVIVSGIVLLSLS